MPNESSPSPVHRTAQSLLASALDDESASILLSALGVSPSSLSSSLSSSPLSSTSSPSLPTAFSEDRVQALASSLSNLKRREVEKRVVPLLLARYRFVRVASPSSAPSSSLSQSQTLYALPPHALAYERVNLLNLSQELLTEANTWLDASEQAKIIDTLFSMAPAFTVIPKRFYAISTQLYWDTHSHKLVPTVPTSEHCFIRLFDTPNPTPQTPSIPLTSLDESFSALVQREYQETLALISSSTHPITSLSDIAHTLPRSFRFIEEWADDDPGLYWDIMTLISTVFMEHKPLGAYFLIGLSRNAKSTCANLLHTIFGTQNTSRVRLSQLGDPHHASALATSILNAPDDEDDDITQYQGAFKELASHSVFHATKLYSATPLEVDGSHLTFVFPVNTLPMWKGTSASACSKRTIPLAFTRTFDSSDTSLTSFEEQTFTRDTLGRIVAQAMALATFYQERPGTFGYSTTTTSQKQSIQAENDSVSLFRASFVKYFGGFQNWSLLYEDYCHWCQHKEYRYQQRSALQLCFNDCKHESCRGSRTYLTASGKTCKKFRRLPKPRPRTRPLMPDLYLPELKRDVASLHRSGLSAVYELEECYGTNT